MAGTNEVIGLIARHGGFLACKGDGEPSGRTLWLGMLSLADVQRFASLAGLQGITPRLSTDFLKEILDNKLQRVLLIRESNFEDLGEKQQLFDQLKQASRDHRAISFEYRKAKGVKIVNVLPYSLVLHGGIWYLAATDAGKLKAYWSMSTILTARRQLSWPVEAGNESSGLLS